VSNYARLDSEGRPTNTVEGQGQPHSTQHRTVWEPPLSAQHGSRRLDWRRLGLLFARPSFDRLAVKYPTDEEQILKGHDPIRRCVKGLATLPRIPTPVVGFRRLVRPCPRATRSLTSLESPSGTAESAPAARSAVACVRLATFAASSPEGLGLPFPSAGLEPKGVTPETSNTVIRLYRVSTLKRLDGLRVRPSRENLNG